MVGRIAIAAVAQIGRWAGIDGLGSRIVVQRTIGPADFADRYNSWSGGSIGPHTPWHNRRSLGVLTNPAK